MPTEIKMPQLGESVTEGTVGRWLKQPGERVEQYEALLEVTTDKVDTEVPAPATGIVRQIVVPEGQTVRVGTLLAILDDDGRPTTDHRPPTTDHRPPTTDTADRRPTTDDRRPTTTDTTTGTRRGGAAESFISPVVARLAAEHRLDLGAIEGSGQNGRVTKRDVLNYIEARQRRPVEEAPARAKAAGEITSEPTSEPALQETATPGPRRGAPAEAPQETIAPSQSGGPGARSGALLPVEPEGVTAAPLPIPEDAEIVPLTAMRRSIAEHMVRSRRTAPHVTTVAEVDVSRIVAHRERRKADFERQGVRLTYTPYFVQASVAGLQAVPIVNASYSDEGIVMHGRIHIGVAVALDEGLIVPVVRDADEKNLLGLARAVHELSDRARRRRLTPDETQGGTFTITNHGVGGSLFAMPIINQPQSAILGIGAIQKRAVVITQDDLDAIAIRTMCYCSLTFDHRLIDGALADQFLMALKDFLEGYAD
jgi:2-oxoisovalerate dehydrogenase E2 component (dihydrolipoyl transacylase)